MVLPAGTGGQDLVGEALDGVGGGVEFEAIAAAQAGEAAVGGFEFGIVRALVSAGDVVRPGHFAGFAQALQAVGQVKPAQVEHVEVVEHGWCVAGVGTGGPDDRLADEQRLAHRGRTEDIRALDADGTRGVKRRFVVGAMDVVEADRGDHIGEWAAAVFGEIGSDLGVSEEDFVDVGVNHPVVPMGHAGAEHRVERRLLVRIVGGTRNAYNVAADEPFGAPVIGAVINDVAVLDADLGAVVLEPDRQVDCLVVDHRNGGNARAGDGEGDCGR